MKDKNPSDFKHVYIYQVRVFILQWNLRITGQVGAGGFVRYAEVSFIGRLYHK